MGMGLIRRIKRKIGKTRAMWIGKGEECLATATWENKGNYWECISASKRARWLIGHTGGEKVKELMDSRGLDYHWIRVC